MSSKGLMFSGLMVLAGAATAAPTCSGVGPNLVSNPGLEASDTSISPWQSTLDDTSSVRVAHPGHQSKNSISLFLNQAYAGFGQDVETTCPGDHYFQLDYRYRQSAQDARSFSTSVLASYLQLNFDKQSNTTWTTLSDYAPATNDAQGFNVTYYTKAPVDNRILFDNFKLVSAGAVKVKSGAPERITNGGFETGSLAPWVLESRSSNTSVVSPGLDGSKFALKVDPSPSGLQQNVTLIKGAHYLFTLEYEYPNVIGNGPAPILSLTTIGGRLNSLAGRAIVDRGSDFVKQGRGTFSRRIVAHGDETLVVLGTNVALFNTSGVGSTTIDNISLKEIEKPVVA